MEQQILSPDTFTKEQVARGIEARWYRCYMIISIIFFVVFLALTVTVFTLVQDLADFAIELVAVVVFAVVIYAICLIYNFVGYRRVINCVGRLPICKVTLTNPQRKFIYRRRQMTYYFTVQIHTANGSFEANTRPMFAIGLVAPARLSRYENREVYVYFDETVKKVYVIDLVDNLPLPTANQLY